MAQISPDSLKTFGISAAVLGIIQGSVWTVLAIVGIAEHFANVSLLPTTHGEFINTYLLIAIKVSPASWTLDGIGLVVITFFYLGLSLVWLSVSVLLLMNLRRSEYKRLKTLYTSWGGIALITCIYDIIVVSLLVANYISFRDMGRFYDSIYGMLAYGILFSLAARGYVLWIINFAMAVLMILKAKKMSNQPRTDLSASHMLPRSDYGQQNYENRGWIDDTHNFNTQNITAHAPQQSGNFRQAPPPPSGLVQKAWHGSGPQAIPNPQSVDNMRLSAQASKNKQKNIAPLPKPNYIYPTGPGIPNPDYSPTPQMNPSLHKHPQSPFTFNRDNNYRY